MKLDFSQPTMTVVEYERHTYGQRYDRYVSEWQAADIALDWQAADPCRVAILDSVKVDHHKEVVTECEDGCAHCPTMTVTTSSVSFYGFADVAEKHKDAVRQFGKKLTVVRCPVVRDLTFALVDLAHWDDD